MSVSILHSVGKGGVNRRDDVAAIQAQINLFIQQLGIQRLTVDGFAGPRTVGAIVEFQRKIEKLVLQNGCVDTNGGTLNALNATPGAGAPAPAAVPTSPVTYKADVPSSARIVSAYSIKVIEQALSAAGMSAAVITSTLRPPAEQAEIMYRNATKNLTGQYALYGATGDQILDVYKANKTKPKAVVVALMEKKIEELANKGQQVSNHVTTTARYANRNIIDIGVNSTKAAAGATFDLAKLTKAFRKLETDGYIKRFIDETAKTNQCWHLEIVPNAKAIP